MYVTMYVCMCVCMYICTHACRFVCMYLSQYACVCRRKSTALLVGCDLFMSIGSPNERRSTVVQHTHTHTIQTNSDKIWANTCVFSLSLSPPFSVSRSVYNYMTCMHTNRGILIAMPMLHQRTIAQGPPHIINSFPCSSELRVNLVLHSYKLLVFVGCVCLLSSMRWSPGACKHLG